MLGRTAWLRGCLAEVELVSPGLQDVPQVSAGAENTLPATYLSCFSEVVEDHVLLGAGKPRARLGLQVRCTPRRSRWTQTTR